MNYGDYLFEQEDEISLTDKLLLMDRALMQVHSENKFISSSLLDAYIIRDEENPKNDKIDPSSIAVDVFDAEKNDKDFGQDIMELAAIGISAYNRFGEDQGFPTYYTNPSFIANLTNIEELEKYLRTPNMPDEVKDYYRNLFTLLNIGYMSSYLQEKMAAGGKGNVRVLNYSTPEGRAIANNQEQTNGFASIISIPAVLAIVYILSMIVIIALKLFK